MRRHDTVGKKDSVSGYSVIKKGNDSDSDQCVTNPDMVRMRYHKDQKKSLSRHHREKGYRHTKLREKSGTKKVSVGKVWETGR